VPDIWMPGVAAPSLEEFVRRVHAQIERYTSTHGADQSEVRLELVDGRELPLKSLSAEPGFGFVTVGMHEDGDDRIEELIVPVHAIRGIALGPAEADRARFGFALPGGEKRETGPAA
jgi:hypothetical protein